MDELIRREIEEIQKQEGCGLEEPHAFEVYVLISQHYNGTIDETTFQEAYNASYGILRTDGPGDHGIDGYFWDNTTNDFYLYQSKYCTGSSQHNAKEALKELVNGFEKLTHLSSNPSQTKNKFMLQAGEKLRHTLNDEAATIHLKIATNREWNHPEAAIEEFEQLKRQNKVHEQVQFNILSRDELQRSYLANSRDDLNGEAVEFDVYSGTEDPILRVPVLEAGQAVKESLVVLLSGKGLGHLCESWGSRLVEANVRKSLGSNPVNKSMRKALNDPERRHRFWYGHNGVTIVCEGLSVVGNMDCPHSIRLENPQIVNGCQTSYTLRDFFKEDSPPADFDVPITARIIHLSPTKRDKYANEIAHATNHQSAVKNADLASNDRHLVALEEKLKQLPTGWFFERKRGGKKDLAAKIKAEEGLFKTQMQQLYGSPIRCVDREIYQQSWRAINGDPLGSVTKKNDVWDVTGALFEEVFSLERRAVDALLVHEMWRWYSQLYTIKGKGSDRSSYVFELFEGLRNRADQMVSAKALVVAYSVAMTGYFIARRYGSIDKMPEASAHTLIDDLNIKKSWYRGDPFSGAGSSFESFFLIAKTIATSWPRVFDRLAERNRLNEEHLSLYQYLKKPGAWNDIESIIETGLQYSIPDYFSRIDSKVES